EVLTGSAHPRERRERWSCVGCRLSSECRLGIEERKVLLEGQIRSDVPVDAGNTPESGVKLEGGFVCVRGHAAGCSEIRRERCVEVTQETIVDLEVKAWSEFEGASDFRVELAGRLESGAAAAVD